MPPVLHDLLSFANLWVKKALHPTECLSAVVGGAILGTRRLHGCYACHMGIAEQVVNAQRVDCDQGSCHWALAIAAPWQLFLVSFSQ